MLQHVPADIIVQHVMSRLSLTSLAALACTSRTLRKLATPAMAEARHQMHRALVPLLTRRALVVEAVLKRAILMDTANPRDPHTMHPHTVRVHIAPSYKVFAQYSSIAGTFTVGIYQKGRNPLMGSAVVLGRSCESGQLRTTHKYCPFHPSIVEPRIAWAIIDVALRMHNFLGW